jgi:hypothetical protein
MPTPVKSAEPNGPATWGKWFHLKSSVNQQDSTPEWKMQSGSIEITFENEK